jgi:N,N'-diacetyllegionaminate synthase
MPSEEEGMSPILVIAEAGVNHNGSIEVAKRLIDAAVSAGADIVKFQTFKADRLVSKDAEKAEYQKRTTGGNDSQYDMIRRLELDEADHSELMAHCRRSGVEFLSTAFDIESVDILARLGVRRWKIPSGEVTNLPYLRAIGAKREEVLLSTGMCGLGEVEAALTALEAAGTSRSGGVLLHWTTEYPAPVAEVNLKAMETLGNAFHARYGYSDHTEGISIPIAAAALGASVIEKHFTLDRGMEGPDHKASLEPKELAAMVRGIREVEAALGDGVKRPTASEMKNRSVARKSIVAARDIKAGEVFGEGNLTTKRPGRGVSPMEWDRVLGRKSARDYRVDEAIEL